MTRDDLIDILTAKKFNSLDDMAEYFEKQGFEVEIENVNWECLFVSFTNSTDKLDFTSMYDPWRNKWVVVVNEWDNPFEDGDVIHLR